MEPEPPSPEAGDSTPKPWPAHVYVYKLFAMNAQN